MVASKVLASAANGVEQMIGRCHGDVESIFGNTGFRLCDLENPYNELSLRKYCCLFEEAAKQTKNENFGLWFGYEFEPKRLGPLGYIAINSPTMNKAVNNLIKYFVAHQNQSVLTLTHDHDVFFLNYRITDPRIRNRRQDAALSLGMFCNIFKHCLGARWSPIEVRLEHPEVGGSDDYESCFGAPVRFQQPTNSIVFRRSDLDAVMPNVDSYLFGVIEPMLAERRSVQQDPGYFVASIKEHIRARLGSGNVAIDTIASDLDVSPASFGRKLKLHGIKFRDLLNGARYNLALEYVSNPDISLTEVALVLGYSEQSAFSRAFRKWTGTSPRDYRNALFRT